MACEIGPFKGSLIKEVFTKIRAEDKEAQE